MAFVYQNLGQIGVLWEFKRDVFIVFKFIGFLDLIKETFSILKASLSFLVDPRNDASH